MPEDTTAAPVQETAPAPAETTAPAQTADDSITLSRAEHEKLLQDLGSLKRENKDLKKPKEPATSAPDELIQKTFLRAAQITDKDEVQLALDTAKKWDMSLDQLVDDADWQEKLEKHRTRKANDAAVSDVKGGPGTRSANQTAEFYVARNAPPTRDEVPDRKVRAGIIRQMMANNGNSKRFYND